VQIAITQPIRLDDVVIVEGEWGRIEEITLTYVVVRIWDERRLVLPVSYFIEKPFQNWTRTSSNILGTVFLYTDYSVPVDALRKQLDVFLKNHPKWDGRVANIQVTDTKERYMELRILLSSVDSSRNWDLRVDIREKMIDFLNKEYPDCFAKTRILTPGSNN
jgi:small-conductance mechanosensitive channel